jgi:hypothetical protein
MPWVRIDENALTHRKIIGLSDGAFRLWVAGLAHCQQHLTDGVILKLVLRTLIGMTAKRVDELVSSGLWLTHSEGYEVNDYLSHNESRAVVLEKRAAAKDRMRGRRSRELPANFSRTPSREQTEKFACGVDSSVSQLVVSTEGGTGETKPPMTVQQRAGAFCQWYEDAHQRLIGVGYMGSSNDYTRAQELCMKFTDAELRDAATVWFGMDDNFAVTGTRTIPKFASRASDCVLRARRVSA